MVSFSNFVAAAMNCCERYWLRRQSTGTMHNHNTFQILSGTNLPERRGINIPDEAYEEMLQGWNENYFGLLIAFYE